ncbi:MAG: MOP flippase family protein [Candidatus Omnitrophota bacterium]|jgi:PST family polysaccharide transporter
MSLKQKTIKGLFWSGASQAGKQVSQFIITAILARLLSPNDFGLLAMATVFINFGMIFSEMGISSALIQKQDTLDRHYYSAFWLNIAVGIVLTLISIAASPLVAGFYKKPELQIILAVISINYFISSFVVIQQTILTKEMDFKSLAIRDIIAIVLSGGIGIYMAFHGFGVWSLVIQSVTFTLFNAILLWALSSWRPKYQFAKSDIKDIFGFSANLTGFNIINYFARNIDQLLIGKFLGAQALGYYSLAYKLMLYPLQNIAWVISKVMFPAFSKIQDSLEKVRRTYLKTVKAIALIAFPVMLGLFAVAPEFVNVVFGNKWSEAIPTIRILCICGLFQSIGTTVGMIYLSMGRAGLQLKLQFLGTILVIVCVLIGMRWGINGVALFYTLQSVIWIIINLHIVSKLTGFGLGELFSNLKTPVLISVCAILPFIIFRNIILLPQLSQLIFFVFCWVASYMAMLLITKEIAFKNRMPTLAILDS